MFVHSSLVSPLPINPCSSLCLLTLTSARCSCPLGSVPQDSLSQSCIYPDFSNLRSVSAHSPPVHSSSTESPVEVDHKEYQEVRVEATENTEGRNKGAILAVVTILVLAVVIVLILVFCIKCRRPKKNAEVGLT